MSQASALPPLPQLPPMIAQKVSVVIEDDSTDERTKRLLSGVGNHSDWRNSPSAELTEVVKIINQDDAFEFTCWVYEFATHPHHLQVRGEIVDKMVDIIKEYPDTLPLEIWLFILRINPKLSMIKSLLIRKGMDEETFMFFMGLPDTLRLSEFLNKYGNRSSTYNRVTMYAMMQDLIKKRHRIFSKKHWYNDAMRKFRLHVMTTTTTVRHRP